MIAPDAPRSWVVPVVPKVVPVNVVILAEVALNCAPLAKTTAPDPVLEAIVILGAEPPEEAKGDEAVTPVINPVPVAVIVIDPALLVIPTPAPAVRVLSANPEPLPISN